MSVPQLKNENNQNSPESTPSKPQGIKASAPIERASFYAKILYFKDQTKEKEPFVKKPISLLMGTLKDPPRWLNEVPLYDEAFYLKEYHLHKNHPDTLSFESDSSFMTDVIVVSPNSPDRIIFEDDRYKRSGYQKLTYHLKMDGLNDIRVIHKYYNGFQDKQKSGGYQSNGSFHLPYEVAEAVVTFDFSAITTVNPNNRFRIRKGPRLSFTKKKENQRQSIVVTPMES